MEQGSLECATSQRRRSPGSRGNFRGMVHGVCSCVPSISTWLERGEAEKPGGLRGVSIATSRGPIPSDAASDGVGRTEVGEAERVALSSGWRQVDKPPRGLLGGLGDESDAAAP